MKALVKPLGKIPNAIIKLMKREGGFFTLKKGILISQFHFMGVNWEKLHLSSEK